MMDTRGIRDPASGIQSNVYAVMLGGIGMFRLPAYRKLPFPLL